MNQRYWLVTFHRFVLWAVGAVLVEAKTQEAARQVVESQLGTERAQRAKVRRAPRTFILAALGHAPLARRGAFKVLRESD